MSKDKITYRYAIKVAYIGKNYAGSQIQIVKRGNPPPTIQQELEKALSTLKKMLLNNPGDIDIKRPIKTIFSGRTDAGVNSKGQIVHFDSDKPIVASVFVNSLNELLPKDISVSDLTEVDLMFHAQKSAKKRYYQYVFYNRKYKDAFDGDNLLIKYEIDIDRVQKALNFILGKHDFSSFKSSGSENPHNDCFIYKAECQKLGEKIVLDIVGNRFLYNMVRAIVGTLLYIERNDLQPEFMKEVLEAKDRSRAGQTVNPYGLTLMKVEY